MSDAQLRELDRRWRREASVEAWTTFAAACARAGHRAPPAEEAEAWAPLRLDLGARLGDPDARRALGRADEPDPDDAYRWVLETPDSSPWGEELFARVATAAVRATAPACRDALVAAIATTVVDRLERWAAAGVPDDEGSKERRALVDAHVETMKFNLRFHGSRSPALLAMTCACSLATPLTTPRTAAANAALHAALVVGAPAVVAQVRRGVIPWVLFAR